MPYAPTERYIGPQLMAEAVTRGAGVLSDSAVKALTDLEQTKKELAYGDTVMDHFHTVKDAQGNPYVPSEALAKYHAASASQKAGMVHGVMANYASDLKQQLEMAQSYHAKAQGDYLKQQTAGLEAQPAEGTVIDLGGGQKYIVGAKQVTQPPKNLPAPGTPAVEGATGKQFGAFDALGHIATIPLPRAAALDPTASVDAGLDRKELADINKQIAGLQGELATGNKRWGPDAIPITESYADQLKKLMIRKASLESGLSAEPAPAAAPGVAPAAPVQPDAAQAAARPGAPVPVRTPAEAQALPAGTRYSTPDGKVYIR